MFYERWSFYIIILIEAPWHWNVLEQQVSLSLPHLHSVYVSQSLPMPTQADVTAMETKTTKMTFIIIPLFLCRCGEVALMSIQTFVKLLILFAQTTQVKIINGICESLSLSFCDLFQLILWLYLLNARNIIILKSHAGSTAPPFMDVTLKIFS